MQQSPAASTRSARPRRWIAPTLGIGVASVIGIAACDSNATAPVVQPPGRAIPVTEVRRATWPTPGGERNSPSGGATVIGTVLPHDGSATPVALPGIFNYRTIVRATFSGSVARTWNIAGQDPAPSYGPAGPGGDGNGGIYLAGGGAGGGAVTSSSGNVPSVEMYLPMLGSYTVGRGGLGQPSHDNPACGPFSTEPFFDCITYSGTGGSMSYETIDVPITGSVSNQNPRTGQIVTFRVQPQVSEIGGLSVALNDIEWLFVADDPADEQPENQWAPAQPTGCNGARQCDQF
ncbi:MAG TPA: hypothetical protein VKA54_16725, partial [Gemmatimonadaceae bacterium]|nr:hypothetical protein [Gemmatimonadaceae bacterium]